MNLNTLTTIAVVAISIIYGGLLIAAVAWSVCYGIDRVTGANHV